MDNNANEGILEDKYLPNTVPAEVVVKARKFNEPKPELMVEFQCPMCDAVKTLDAYLGVPRCTGGRGDHPVPEHRPVIMKGMSLYEEVLDER